MTASGGLITQGCVIESLVRIGSFQLSSSYP